MKNERGYNDIIEKIRSVEPVLEDGEALTTAVVGSIEKLSAEKGRGRPSLAVRWAAASAAAILLGLFIGEIRLSGETAIPAEAEYADMAKYTLPYRLMQKEDAAVLIYERRKRSEDRKHILEKYLKP